MPDPIPDRAPAAEGSANPTRTQAVATPGAAPETEGDKPAAPAVPRHLLMGIEERYLDAAAAMDTRELFYDQGIAVLVNAVRLRPRPEGLGPEYDLLKAEMDLPYYFMEYSDIAQKGIDPVAHYMLAGGREGRNPTPLFSSKLYVKRYPEAVESGLTPFGHYLTHRAGGTVKAARFGQHDELAAILGLTPEAAADHLKERVGSIRDRLESGELGRMVDRANALDPLIGQSWRSAARIRCLPFSSDLVMARIVALNDMQAAAGFRRARFVVTLGRRPRDIHVGAPEMVKQIVRALAAEHGAEEIVLVSTDPEGPPPTSDLPAGLRVIDCAEATRKMNAANALRPFFEFIRSLRPEICIIADDPMSWEMLKVYGRALSASVDLVGLFGRVGVDDHNWRSPSAAQHFYRHFDLLTAVCSDSETTLARFAADYLVPPAQRAKLRLLEPAVFDEAPSAGERVNVLWICQEADSELRRGTRPPRPRPTRAQLRGAAADPPAEHDPAPLQPPAERADPHGPCRWRARRGGRRRSRAGQRHRPDRAARRRRRQTARRLRGGGVRSGPRAGRCGPGRRARPHLRRPACGAGGGGGDGPRAPGTAQRRAVSRSARRPAWPHPPGARRMTDLTVAITAHAETVVAGPSFRSVRAALAPVRERGYDVQLLLGLDSCTPACRDYMTQPDFGDFERHDYAFRDQGRTRNALIGAARGKWVAFLDADDLFSENWLIRAVEELEAAEATGHRVIVHPELNWQFDGINHVYSNPAQDHPFFSPYVLAIANYYDAMCVAPRAVWEELPFPDRAIADGFALEDYQWFVEATALGWRHVVARDTIIFKRRRDASQTHESRGTSAVIRAIEPLAIDNLEKLLPKTGTSS